MIKRFYRGLGTNWMIWHAPFVVYYHAIVWESLGTLFPPSRVATRLCCCEPRVAVGIVRVLTLLFFVLGQPLILAIERWS